LRRINRDHCFIMKLSIFSLLPQMSNRSLYSPFSSLFDWGYISQKIRSIVVLEKGLLDLSNCFYELVYLFPHRSPVLTYQKKALSIQIERIFLPLQLGVQSHRDEMKKDDVERESRGVWGGLQSPLTKRKNIYCTYF